jgi:peptidoglycan/LPS O-acetylase OafA/YrhL
MKNPDSHPRDVLRRAFRIALYGGTSVVVIAYSVLIPLKYRGILPPRMTWSRLLLGPPIAIGSLMVLVATFRSKRPLLLGCIMLFLLLALLAAVAIFDPIESMPDSP